MRDTVKYQPKVQPYSSVTYTPSQNKHEYERKHTGSIKDQINKSWSVPFKQIHIRLTPIGR